MRFLSQLLRSKLLIFALMIYMMALVGGVVYAMTDGRLQISNQSSLTAQLEATIINVKVDHGKGNPTGNGSYGAITKIAGQSMTLSVNLCAPGDTLIYQFQVRNTGKIGAEFEEPQLQFGGKDAENDDVPLLIEGSFEDLSGYTLESGETSADIFTLEVSWDEDNTEEGSYSFTITIPYIVALD